VAGGARHDPGKVLLDVAIALALGGDCLADVAAVRAQRDLFGMVASDPTVCRLFATLSADAVTADRAVAALRLARAAARERVWSRCRPLAGTPGTRDGGQVIVDIDATLVTAHSDKEGAEATHKKSYGFAPMCAFVDHGEYGTGETLALDLRPGKASPFSSVDHIAVLASALQQLPEGERVPPDDSAVREIEDALRIAERSGEDLALSFARVTLGFALVHRHTAAERDRGQQLLAEASNVLMRRGHNLAELPIINVYVARETARRGDHDEAIPVMRTAADHLFREGRLLWWGVPATGVLVETLLDRGAEGDVGEAAAAIERLAAAPADEGLEIREIWLLRLRALLARAHGDDPAYAEFRDRYRDMARTLGFEGHIAWAGAMP
jgi:hypothetical protein